MKFLFNKDIRQKKLKIGIKQKNINKLGDLFKKLININTKL